MLTLTTRINITFNHSRSRFNYLKKENKAFLLSPLDAAWSPHSKFSFAPLPGLGSGRLSAAPVQLRTPVVGKGKEKDAKNLSGPSDTLLNIKKQTQPPDRLGCVALKTTQK